MFHVASQQLAVGKAQHARALHRAMSTLFSKSAPLTARPWKQDTEVVHAAVSLQDEPLVVPKESSLSATLVQDSEDYFRNSLNHSSVNNQTVTILEKKLAVLEQGYGAAAFVTGMAATTSCISATMKAGDHCVISDCSYGGIKKSYREFFRPLGTEFTFVDFRDPVAVKNAMKPNTKLVFSETPANLPLPICDIEEITDIAHAGGAKHVIDATFATPIMCRPLNHGVDMVIQGLTKFYESHSMMTGAAVICKDAALYDRVKHIQSIHGNIIHPVAAFIILQASKTLALRVRRQCRTAMAIADFLESHPKVSKVYYPGLASFPQKALADKYHRDNMHGGILWFDIVGGSRARDELMDSIHRPWTCCENLGANESIISRSAVLTHANMLKQERQNVRAVNGFIRVSCGIEDCSDLIESLSIALGHC